jgi:hypothetical protein
MNLARTVFILLTIVCSARVAAEPSKTETDIAQLHRALAAYFHEYNTLPTGNSVAVMKSLTGDNPRKFIFFAFSSARMGADGAFLDEWKTAFRITFPKPATAEVRSAGPDREFGTHDDVFESNSFP